MLADRIKVTTATTGTGSVTLSATGVRDSTNGDYLAPAEVTVVCGKVVPYFIISGANWCSGIGQLSSNGLTLTRDPNEWRWNGTAYTQALLTLTGTSTVIITPRASDLVNATSGVGYMFDKGTVSP